MFAQGRGAMFDWLARSGRPTGDCGLGSPVRHLERCGLLSRSLLAVHANYLGRGDAALLAKRGVSVAHCPRSHWYFHHAPFPLQRLARAGVNVCLGTDSLATVYKRKHQTLELSMFEEMRALAEREPSLSPKDILRMATVNGARALHLEGRVGELSPGAEADLIAVPYSGKRSDVQEGLVHHRGGVSASLIAGEWVVPPESTKTQSESVHKPHE
jgi:cytosine/adenosine deaminase-related metal-dependent hydrolase